jgi:arylsulfatase A-like enzyme
MVRVCLIVVVLASGLSPTHVQAAESLERPNVLFIAVDDLNHWVGHLGRNRQAKTPNIDRLARMGVTFTRAYCAAPACNPSRAALMSGLRPSSTGVYDNRQDWSSVISTEQTLTTQFLKAGYNVYGAGKIYHSQAHRDGEWTDYFRGRPGSLMPHAEAKNDGVGGIRFKPLTNDSRLPDENMIDYAIRKLTAKHERPFFLAVGLTKPHMPWNVPKRYYDLFPIDEIELPPTKADDLDDIPKSGLKMAGKDRDHARMLRSGRWKEAVQRISPRLLTATSKLAGCSMRLRNPRMQRTRSSYFGAITAGTSAKRNTGESLRCGKRRLGCRTSGLLRA